jgi:hypothetical protein
LVTIAIVALCGGAARLALAQANNFVPPPGIQKYAFYPQGGNFFGDLYPVNFVDLDPTTGILACIN